MAFANAQNPFFVNCSFTEHSVIEHSVNVESHQNASIAALQILWGAIASGAAYNSEERYPHPRCLPKTRVDSIQKIKDWAKSGSSSILWLHGPAGAGKSAVAQTICEAWAEAGLLLASFFFSRTASMRNTLDRFIATLAYQSVQTLIGHLEPILSMIEKNPQLLRLDNQVQLEKLLINPIQSIIGTTKVQNPPRFVVIDAVDECSGNENQLRLLTTVLSILNPKNALPIRFLIVSRPEAHIRHAFDNMLKPVSAIVSLYGAIEDVYKYLEFSFNEIHDSEKHADVMQHVAKPWPGHQVLCELTKRSGGYFIYAATIVRHVDEEGYICTDRLDEVLNKSSRAPGSYPYQELDKVYSQILSTARNIRCLTRILGCIIVGRRALVRHDSLAANVSTSTIINALFSLRPGELKMTLRGLHSIISFSENYTDDIRFYHASFSDYLIDEERSKIYYVDYEATVQDLYTSSLNLIRLPMAPTPFVPGRDWAVVISIWSKLGRPVDLLITYLNADNGIALELLQPLIVQSKQWAEELQFRIICILCEMMFLLKDDSSYKTTTGKLSSFCQSALVLYLSPSNTMAGLNCLQDVRTLLTTAPLKDEPWRLQRIKVKESLNLSPIERTCVNRFLSYLSHARDLFLHWTQLSIVINLESGTWVDSSPVLEQMLEKFLNNKDIWGDACKEKERVAHLQKRLLDSARRIERSKEQLRIIQQQSTFGLKKETTRPESSSDDDSTEVGALWKTPEFQYEMKQMFLVIGRRSLKLQLPTNDRRKLREAICRVVEPDTAQIIASILKRAESEGLTKNNLEWLIQIPALWKYPAFVRGLNHYISGLSELWLSCPTAVPIKFIVILDRHCATIYSCRRSHRCPPIMSSSQVTQLHDDRYWDDVLSECDQNPTWGSCLLEILKWMREKSDRGDRRLLLRRQLSISKRLSRLPPSMHLHDFGDFSITGDLMPTQTFDVGPGRTPVGVYLKVIRVDNLDERRAIMNSILRKFIPWSCLCHPNVVPFCGIIDQLSGHPEQIGLIFGGMGSDSIRTFIQTHPNCDRFKCVKDIISGLKALHSAEPPIFHHNLSSGNILVSCDYTCRIADFECAEKPGSSNAGGGTLRWRPPEAIMPSRLYSLDPNFAAYTDVWALGCIIYEIYTGFYPYDNYANDEQVTKANTIRHELPGELPSACPPAMQRFVADCWERMPRSRPRLTDPENHRRYGGLFDPPLAVFSMDPWYDIWGNINQS